MKRLTIFVAVVQIAVQPFIQAQIRQQNPAAEHQPIPSFTALLERPVTLKSELRGVHPRLFFTAADLPKLREKAVSGAGRELWREVLRELETLRRPAPDPNDEDLYKSGLDANRKPGAMTQYNFAFQIAQTSFVYAIEKDKKYLEAAKKWTLAACAMPFWGYATNKPNVDLPPAHLLYAVAFAYDVLHDELTADERRIVREKLIKQARLMFEHFKYKPKKRYAYSQNHTSIPLAGLAIAAYALMDEVEEAHDWARLARAVFDRVMLTFAPDGYFYEGFHYLGFGFRWTIRYFDAHRQATGEDLYAPMREKFAGIKYYALHSILPDGENVFDFGDVGDGALNRTGASRREKLYGEYDIFYRLAGVYRDGEAQAVGDFIRNQTELGTREPMWAFLNRDADLKPAPLARIPTSVYFDDNDTVFWRDGWTKTATAVAFRCAPPEGHRAARLASRIPDWRQSTGHAHPDANSFIVWAAGRYLTGDTGYAGQKRTDDHNTILVNGRGQENDGRHEVFKEVSNERLDRIRIVETSATPDYFYARGEAAAAYFADLGLKKFDRHFLYAAGAPAYFVVWDELETEKPAEFSFLLNADKEIRISENTTELINGSAALRVVNLSSAPTFSKIAPQMILARGLPGSVDKGAAEQRGVQLQTTTVGKHTKFEFLHFLQPVSMAYKTAAPKIVERTENGLKIIWASGGEDTVNLRRHPRSIERLRSGGKPLKLILEKSN